MERDLKHIKEVLITTSYPRCGSTYLNQALQLLFYPGYFPNLVNHTVVEIQRKDKLLIPFRDPYDAISSWYLHPRPSTLIEDIRYYIRFHTFVLNNLKKTILMNFESFTKDIKYIENKILTNFDFKKSQEVTDTQIKEAMLANDKALNLPRNNQKELEAVKIALIEISEFQDCLDLYAQLKNCA